MTSWQSMFSVSPEKWDGMTQWFSDWNRGSVSYGELELYETTGIPGVDEPKWIASVQLTRPDMMIGPLKSGTILRFVNKLDRQQEFGYTGTDKAEKEATVAGMDRMTRAEAMSVLKQISKVIELADQLIARYGPDQPEGTVIRFIKHFPPSSQMSTQDWNKLYGPKSQAAIAQRDAHAPAIDYHYAGIKASDGLWYLTGESKTVKTSGVEWEELLEWMDAGIPVDKVELWPPFQPALEDGSKAEAETLTGETTDGAEPDDMRADPSWTGD